MSRRDVVTADTSYDGKPRVQPDVISQHFQEVDGQEVIARELATSPHPRWGTQRMQTHHFITRLLLADETERFECNHCHIIDPALNPIKGHQTSHRPNLPPPLTDEEVLRTVIREVERARRLYGANHYGKHAVEALTLLGVQSASGTPWTAEKVSSLYNRYKDRYPVRVPRVRGQKLPQARKAAEPVLPARVKLPQAAAGGRQKIVDEISQALADAGKLLNAATRLLVVLSKSDAEQVIDQAIAAKADRYDALEAALGKDTLDRLLA